MDSKATMMIIAAVLASKINGNSHTKNDMAPPVSPYAKPRLAAPVIAHNEANMGQQSQQRIGNQNAQKYKLASNNSNSSNKRRKGGQLTLFGGAAFEAEKDCVVCKARALQRIISTYRVPNRSHHVLCSKNTKTRGKGELTEHQLLTLEDNNRYKAITQPITEARKAVQGICQGTVALRSLLQGCCRKFNHFQ